MRRGVRRIFSDARRGRVFACSGPYPAVLEDHDHIPVLLDPFIELVRKVVASKQGGPVVYADATAGLGGHAAAAAELLPAGSTIALNDLDAGNLVHAQERIRRKLETAERNDVRIITQCGNFASLPRWLNREGLTGRNGGVDLLLADLGFASNQVDDASRGLSFLRDGPLDMRLATGGNGVTAAELVASMSETDLAQIIFEYGDERHSRAIARGLVEARRAGPITTTHCFAEVVREALKGKVPPRQVSGIDPATKTFQALRIAVNDELGNLGALLDQIEKGAAAAAAGGGWLAPGATVTLITFHSLEDRPVKQAFARMTEAQVASDVTRKPITADESELAANPRARSAKMRAVRLTGGAA